MPLLLTLKSSNEQALDTLSDTKAIKLFLVRSIALGSDSMEERADRRSNTVFPSGAGQAYFWPSAEGARESGKRILRGELEVKKSAKPSFLFPRFSIRVSDSVVSLFYIHLMCSQYTMQLLPFSATGFVSLGTESGKPLLSEPVKITTQSVDSS